VREEALAEVGSVARATPAAVLSLADVFQLSRDHGLTPESLRRIANEWAPRMGMGLDEVTSYLTVNIHYSLDKECQEGLRLFYSYAEECGSLPAVKFVEKASANK